MKVRVNPTVVEIRQTRRFPPPHRRPFKPWLIPASTNFGTLVGVNTCGAHAVNIPPGNYVWFNYQTKDGTNKRYYYKFATNAQAQYAFDVMYPFAGFNYQGYFGGDGYNYFIRSLGFTLCY